VPKFTISDCSYQSLRQSPPLKDCQVELASVQVHSVPTVPMHRGHTVRGCVSKALPHASRGIAASRVNGMAAGVGLSNEPLDGFTDFADFGSAMSAAQTFIRPFSCWSARSSAGGTLNGVIRDTKVNVAAAPLEN
jgi:hypothetical protein